MNYLMIGLILLIGIIIIGVIILGSRKIEYNRKKKEKLLTEIGEISQQKESLEQEISELFETESKIAIRLKDQEDKNRELDKEIFIKQNQLDSLHNSYAGTYNLLTKMKEDKEKEVNEYRESIKKKADEEALKYASERKEELLKIVNEEISLKEADLNLLKQEVENYKQQQAAINENILRNKELLEKEEFYSIQLDENDNHDIEILEKIKIQLLKIDKLNKLIYDNYISKSAKEMIKRVLGGKNVSGIYKITNKNTGEIYIGKSTNIGNRWQGHIKSVYGLEGVADSQFQRALKKNGIQNFTWELLEEAPKDSLTEKEKYWIDYFNTTVYGYNERRG